MKITVEIPDEEIRQEVFEKLTDRLADEVFTTRWSNDGMTYRRILEESINAMLKNHADEIIDRCIPQAASYIGKKGVAKFVKTLQKEDNDE